MRHSEHAHLLSNIEKLTLPILGSLFPFWSPTGDLVCRLEPTSTKDSLSVVCCSSQFNVLGVPARRRVRGPRAPLARTTLGRSGLRPCATLSMLAYYRTSRSLHFPFWAVCSLSGAQPEIWSVGWNPPVERIACRLFLASLQSTSFVVTPAEGEGAPGSSGPVHRGPVL